MRNSLSCAAFLSLTSIWPLAAQIKPVPKTTATAVHTVSPPLIFQLRSGDQVVRGSAEPAVTAVRIKIFSADGQLVQQNDALVDKSDLRFFAGLRRPLESNQVVQVYSVVNGRESSHSNPMLVTGDAAGAAAQAQQNTDAGGGQPQQSGRGKGPHVQEGNDAGPPLQAGNNSAQPASSGGTAAPSPQAGGNAAPATNAGSGGGQPGAGSPPQTAQVPPVIRDSPAPAQSEITVNATPTLPDNVEVRIYPIRNGTPVGAKISGNLVPFVVTDDKGQAVIVLEDALAAEDKLQVEQRVVTKTTNTVTDVTEADKKLSATKVVIDPLDLGRVRYYFTSGVVMSNDHGFQSQGTQAGLFLGLDADRAWWVPTKTRFGTFGLNTYFDSRLTSVSTQTAGGQTQSSTTGTAATTSNLDSFMQSQKAASLQAGIYIPWITSAWKRGPERYAFFVAPLAKAGFTTLADTPTVATPQTTATTTGTTSTTTTAASQPLTDRFFTSYGYGARLGVSRIFTRGDGSFKHSAAPDLVSYVDVIAGKFGNFEAFRDLTLENATAMGKTNPPGIHELLRRRPWRYSFEGLLKIPHSVFIIGFNANIGHGALAGDMINGKTYPYTQPRDDLRFLFGARFDFSKFLKVLPTL